MTQVLMVYPFLQPIVIFFSGLIGLVVGSFLNVCILRIPAEKSVVSPGSHCPKCKNPLKWYHNIPLVSYLALKGRCSFCGSTISWQYPMVEVMTSILLILMVLQSRTIFEWPFHMYLLCSLIMITFIDLRHWIIPNVITYPGMVIGLVGSLVIPHQKFLHHLIGFLFGGLLLYSVAWIYEKIAKREGLGGGDIKYLAMIGSFLGIQGVLITIMIGSVIGALFGIGLMAVTKQKSTKTAIPFGPFLVIGTLAAFFFGEGIWHWYISAGAIRVR